MRHPLTLLTLILVAAAGWLHLAHRPASDEHPNRALTTPGRRVQHVNAAGTVVSIPTEWIADPAPSGVHVWRSADRGANITIAQSPATSEPLDHILSGAARSLADSLDHGRVVSVRSRLSTGAFEVRGMLPNTPQHVRITQTWQRTSGSDTWVVMSWVDTPSHRVATALRMQGMRKLRGT